MSAKAVDIAVRVPTGLEFFWCVIVESHDRDGGWVGCKTNAPFRCFFFAILFSFITKVQSEFGTAYQLVCTQIQATVSSAFTAAHIIQLQFLEREERVLAESWSIWATVKDGLRLGIVMAESLGYDRHMIMLLVYDFLGCRDVSEFVRMFAMIWNLEKKSWILAANSEDPRHCHFSADKLTVSRKREETSPCYINFIKQCYYFSYLFPPAKTLGRSRN